MESKQSLESMISMLKGIRTNRTIDEHNIQNGHKQLIELLFKGKECDSMDIFEIADLPVAFIEEELNQRLQEKEKNNKIGFIQKVKAFFARIFGKTKGLPAPTTDVSTRAGENNGRETFLKGIHQEIEMSPGYERDGMANEVQKSDRTYEERT